MPDRILVVDDEPDIAALVAYHLAKKGYRVSTANSGEEALETASEERPDVIVLDLMLTGRSGFEVLQELRKRAETPHIGVIVLTARNERGDRLKGLELGADDYLGKPFLSRGAGAGGGSAPSAACPVGRFAVRAGDRFHQNRCRCPPRHRR